MRLVSLGAFQGGQLLRFYVAGRSGVGQIGGRLVAARSVVARIANLRERYNNPLQKANLLLAECRLEVCALEKGLSHQQPS